ncbi:MAG: VanZ family protein [Candidatus Promineifilaceae bacterium]
MNANTKRLPRKRFVLVVFVGGLLFILYTTLNPFSFNFAAHTWRDLLAGFVFLPSSVLDFLCNILLFIPFGFGLAALIDGRGWSSQRVTFAVAVCGFSLTLLVETLQNFLPYRQPSVTDMLTNTAGALVGLGCLRSWQTRSWTPSRLSSILSGPGVVLSGVAVYVLVLLLIAYELAAGAGLSAWDASYELLVGNEAGGERPWLGTIGDVVFLDRALSLDEAHRLLEDPQAFALSDELRAFYPLADGGLQDKSGQQPALVWHTEEGRSPSTGEWPLDGSDWLVSSGAVSDLSRSLQSSSQFTLRLTANPTTVDQSGPARLVTNSGGTESRNFTVGQDGTALVVRLRNNMAGDNGTSPQSAFPNLFDGSGPVKLGLIFDGLSLTLVSSNSTNSRFIEYVPGITFLDALLPFLGSYWRVTDERIFQWLARLFFYVCMLLPLSFLLTRPEIRRWPKAPALFLYLVLLLGVPLLLELAMVYPLGRAPRPLNILIAMLITIFVGWLITPRHVRRRKPEEAAGTVPWQADGDGPDAAQDRV